MARKRKTPLENFRETWAKRFRDFRSENLMSQVTLAEVLEISRRELQYIEGAVITPGVEIRDRFNALAKKFNEEKLREAQVG